MNELLNKIRPMTDKDKCLPEFSYSKLDTYKKCPMQYKLKYIEQKSTQDTNLALELGGLLHYILEQKGKMIKDGTSVQYDKLQNWLTNGVAEDYKPLRGIAELKREYSEEWFKPDDASGMNYEQKLSVFDTVLHREIDNSDWTPVSFEHEFRFVWDNRAIIHGFIDRIDQKGNKYRIIDYKTSKKLFDERDTAASLQFGIYAMALLNDFGALPEKAIYRFILLDKEQTALSENWEEILINELDNLLDNIDSNTQKNVFEPKPVPLCYWCNYCKQNPNASDYKNECEYYSKWTPENRTKEVNKLWNSPENAAI